jgi:hypothetical protein
VVVVAGALRVEETTDDDEEPPAPFLEAKPTLGLELGAVRVDLK